jgi:response regulator of citrate/malate metabolism
MHRATLLQITKRRIEFLYKNNMEDKNREQLIEARMTMEERVDKLRRDFKELTLEKILEWLGKSNNNEL